MHAVGSAVVLQQWNSLRHLYWTLMSSPLLSIADVMIMEMSHCSPLPSIAKLLTGNILFGSTRIWGEETVKWFRHVLFGQLEIIIQLQMDNIFSPSKSIN